MERAHAMRPNGYIMKYNPEIHHRRSIRLKGYDYTQPGAYFVTIVTHKRDEIFGEITNGRMKYSTLGEIVYQEWFRSAKIRKEIRLFEDEIVIMPNHIHGIVRIMETAGADGVRPNNGIRPESKKAPTQQDAHREQDTRRASLQRVPRSLGSFVAGFKAWVTSRAEHELHMTGIWQRNYHEHIIRNETDFNNIWNYIDTNPLHWQDDQLHPSALPNKYNQE